MLLELMKRNANILLGLILILFCSSFELSAQDNDEFIYGKITTRSDDVYEGYIRWGKEEVTWHDIFNSTKADSRKKKGKGSLWGDFDWSIGSLWKDEYRGSNHTFACQFGDIAKLHIKGREKIDIELKNGALIKVDGGSNDIDATLNIRDYELGVVKFDWDRIEMVEFFEAPASNDHRYAKILYGTVETRRDGSFTGYIKWDKDERLGDDILDGDSRNGDQKIPFENIISIEKERDGSLITFKSGRDIYLDGSNDVDNGNRGIEVYDPEIGNIIVPWKKFQRITFTDSPDGVAYSDYPNPEPLRGYVIDYRGDKYEGQIIFDKDEIWDFEFLDAYDDDIHFQIPFRNILQIIPKNRSFSEISLKNGKEFLLGDAQDVSSKNDGILIVNKNQKDPVSISWDDLDEIIFND